MTSIRSTFTFKGREFLIDDVEKPMGRALLVNLPWTQKRAIHLFSKGSITFNEIPYLDEWDSIVESERMCYGIRFSWFSPIQWIFSDGIVRDSPYDLFTTQDFLEFCEGFQNENLCEIEKSDSTRPYAGKTMRRSKNGDLRREKNVVQHRRNRWSRSEVAQHKRIRSVDVDFN